MDKEIIFREIDRECGYSSSRTAAQSGPTKSIAEWLLEMEYYLEKAKQAVYNMGEIRPPKEQAMFKRAAMDNIRKSARASVHAMQSHGCPTVNVHPVLRVICRKCGHELLVPEGIEGINCYNCGAPQERQSHENV